MENRGIGLFESTGVSTVLCNNLIQTSCSDIIRSPCMNEWTASSLFLCLHFTEGVHTFSLALPNAVRVNYDIFVDRKSQKNMCLT